MGTSKYLDLLSDIGFKNAFGIKGRSEEFLIDFLNQLLEDEPDFDPIVSVEYRNVEKSPNHIDDKTVRYDLYCDTSSGHRFIVEMQKRNKSNFRDRATYYLAREIYDQGLQSRDGEWKYGLLPVVGVFITNFFVNGIDRELVVPGKMVNLKTGNVVLEKVNCYFVQLEAFNKTKEECLTGFDKWIDPN